MEEQLQLLDELIALAKKNSLTELSIRFGGVSLSLKKEPPLISGESCVTEIKNTAIKNSAKFNTAAPDQPSSSVLPSNLAKVASPLAGVFYRAPSPTTRPFTEIGQMVSGGQVLCIIEAMKIMNEITCDLPGVVVQILVENGTVVEEGETLFLIDKGGI